MKKTILFSILISALMLTSACKSVQKLVDQGRYDDAIVLATKKLAGKKNKKTKHIVALEDAFAKVNQRDIDHISRLRVRNDVRSWEEVYNYALRIRDRQSRIKPFLPLVSKDNYVASFQLIDADQVLSEASVHAAKLLYDDGKVRLAHARMTKDKLAAQEAFYQLEKIRGYFASYEDVVQLLEESNALGTFHILLKVDDANNSPLTYAVSTARQLARLDTKWKRHHLNYIDGIAFDAVTTMYIDNVDISPERERVNTFIERKELERWVDQTDEYGNVMLDSLGKVIQYKEIEKVRADITEVLRTKNAIIQGSIETKDYATGDVIDKEHFSHHIDFASDGCDLIGDRRAISDGVRKRLDLTLLPFPTDFDMVSKGIDRLMDNYAHHIRSIDLTKHYRSSLVIN